MLFFCLICIALANAELNASNTCGISSVNREFHRFDMLTSNHRLVGGVESKPHAWPWTGQLLNDNRHQCGLALLAPNILITAAHCFARSRKTSKYKVLLGGHKIFSGQPFSITEIIIHPLYQIRASAYDIALVKISPPAELSETISTICLPSTPPVQNKMCVVAGWGRLSEEGARPDALQEIHVPIMPPYICNNFRHYAGRMDSASMLCAGYTSGKVDSCQGDSGGPLHCQNARGIWELHGVVSWGIGCAAPEYPGVYSKIFAMIGWIRSKMAVLSKD